MKLSIITINYNNKIGLEKTIKSVVNQTYKDFEYIVIDGNSNDGSKKLIEDYKNKISVSISEPDSGIYNAMNKGIKLANGEYLLFLNSGDSLLIENVLHKVISNLNSEKDIFYGNLIYSKEGKPIFKNIPPKKLTFSYFLEHSLPHPASFIKKDLFNKFFLYNETLKIVSDWEFFIYSICKQSASYQHLDIDISDFDNTGMSSNPENLDKQKKEKEQVILNHFPLFFEDSKLLLEAKTKRFQDVLFIKNNKIRWKILKFLINILKLGKKNPKKNYIEFF